MTHLDPVILRSAVRFVVPIIEGDIDHAPDSTPADVVGLGLSIHQWAPPEDGWSPQRIAKRFAALYPRRKPRALTPDRCARVILAALDEEIIHIYIVGDAELLLELAKLCGPTNHLRLLRFVEAWVESAPDEAFIDEQAEAIGRLKKIRRLARTMGIGPLDVTGDSVEPVGLVEPERARVDVLGAAFDFWRGFLKGLCGEVDRS